MKRLGALLVLVLGLALAQAPAFPETYAGAGVAANGAAVQFGLVLPFAPMGLDTGLDGEVVFAPNPQGQLAFKALLLPSLTLADTFAAVGLASEVRLEANAFGAHLGPVASLDLGEAVLSATAGLGFFRGVHVSYGLGLRAYLDPLALEVATSDRYAFRASLLYLW
ncbi:hypothetical protein [Marinithermus hydrothermalis]|uniref:Bioflim formation protein n=1 Tax=Marinithermus hydrothermalis (strain DSM 14884 / JCM 11576 / T1) TaxID=869210 RepID=F2NR45_MARHT|nr:hypothetical protein [Marinithermus hydrothermalis]AEB12894.1 hypothetical protein Marky_2172 [Marinithermus hydrothermalis DSM 14884]